MHHRKINKFLPNFASNILCQWHFHLATQSTFSGSTNGERKMNVALKPSDFNKSITYMNEWLCNEEPTNERVSESNSENARKRAIKISFRLIKYIYVRDTMGVIKSRNEINWHWAREREKICKRNEMDWNLRIWVLMGNKDLW